jgi:hypothetical protein
MRNGQHGDARLPEPPVERLLAIRAHRQSGTRPARQT